MADVVTFGRLTVVGVEYVGVRKWAVARCSCGGTWRGAMSSLYAGITRSCGCLRRENGRRLMAELLARRAAR